MEGSIKKIEPNSGEEEAVVGRQEIFITKRSQFTP
jgi:hypothetical protein